MSARSEQPEPEAEVAIVGAGAVGATLALALARQGRRVALVDARPEPPAAPGDDHGEFVVSLNLASISVLRHLGVWSAIHATRVSPYGGMRLWDAGGSGAIDFDSSAIGEPALGCFVEVALLEARLHEALAQYPEVTRLWGRRANAFTVAHDSARLGLEDGATVTASLVVGADGGRSALRRLAGIGVERHDYGQRALVCNFATERAHGAIARQRFLPGGPVAMLPLADGRCSLAWFRPETEAEDLLAQDDAAFCDALTTATDHALGAVTAATRRRSFPIVRRHAVHYVGERVALAGDAAHSIHPLAGQGLNLGMLDAAALAEALVPATDAGEQRGLRAYARWRRGHNHFVMRAMDFFHWQFATPAPVPPAARAAGLALADRVTVAKRRLMRQGVGLVGDRPAMARPVPGRGVGP